MLVKAIADRRQRDLSDIISEQEIVIGWQKAVHYLAEAESSTYSVSFDMSSRPAPIEPLKYREVLFRLFLCTGLEPTSVHTSEVLEVATEEESFIDASRAVRRILVDTARNQIEKGDIIFFDIDSEESFLPSDTVTLIHEAISLQSNTISIQEKNGQLDVSTLWHTEGGWQALSQLGIRGSFIDRDSLDVVLSVIPFSIPDMESVRGVEGSETGLLHSPSMDVYKELLHYIVDQDILGLQSLGSRHAIPALRTMVNEAVSEYEASAASKEYKRFLDVIGAHVRIRSLESIPALERICYHEDSRISNAAVIALASFYHESAVFALGRFLCTTRNAAAIESTSKAIVNISKKCPEAGPALQEAASTDCERPARISGLLREMSKTRRKYYL